MNKLLRQIQLSTDYDQLILSSDKFSDRINSDIWNRFANTVFYKQYIDLSKDEISVLERYVYDYLHPVWKPIMEGQCETGYMISNIGTVIGKRGQLINTIEDNGYERVSGYFNKRPYKISVHRAVAQAFIPNPENKPQVNHINGNKTFNWVGNLEWATAEENTIHAVNCNLMDFKGTSHPENVYDIDTIKHVCKLLEDPSMSNVAISKITGVNRSIVYSIRYGISWSHISKEYNIYNPPRRKGTKVSHGHHEMNPKTKFIYESIINHAPKDDIVDILMRDYGFQSRQLALRSINKVNLRYIMHNDK